jgi:aspartate kinase
MIDHPAGAPALLRSLGVPGTAADNPARADAGKAPAADAGTAPRGPARGILVQKYGGTSVGDTERLARCAARAVAAHRDGHEVVLVVSAMGKATDELLGLARRTNPDPPRNHLDLLLATGEQASAALMAMAIEALGVRAVPLAGPRLGIITESVHGNARIRSIDVNRMHEGLRDGAIVVCAGFQGVTPEGAVTTLGRGGSDTTAVAIAAALGVNEGRATGGAALIPTGACEILTDVDGVYTADPRIVPTARRIERIACEEMVELASLGAGVLHPRAALCAQQYGVPVHVRHSQHAGDGTLIVREEPSMEREAVVGCALTRDLGRLGVRGMPNRAGAQGRLFEAIAAAEVLVDDIIQNEADGRADIAFTVDQASLDRVEAAVGPILDDLGAGTIERETGLAKVSVVGIGMRTHTGVASRMFAALGDAGVVIRNITTSEIKISCLVPGTQGEQALRVVHETFGLAGAGDRPRASDVAGASRGSG